MSDFLALRDSWRDQLLKEYAEQDFEDDGTMLEVNIDTGDDDGCCEMIKMKFLGEMQIINPASSQQLEPQDLTCEDLQSNLERISIMEKERFPGSNQDDPDSFFATVLLKEWDECAKSSERWKHELR